MNLLKPNRLQRGDNVAAISLSSGLADMYPQVFETAKQNLKDLFDINLIPTPNSFRSYDWIYEHPEERANDLHWALQNPDVKAIFSMIGGSESVRILPFVNLGIIRSNPKIFMGFSDSTIIHMAFLNAGVGSFYGPSVMAGLCNLKAFPYAQQSMQSIFFDGKAGPLEAAPFWSESDVRWDDPNYSANASIPVNPIPGEGWKWLQGESSVTGQLIGGCFEVMEMLKGTPWWPKSEVFEGAALFLETSEEAPSPDMVERWLRNYGSQGILEKISALLIAQPRGYTAELKLELEEIILKVLKEFGRTELPVVANMDFGHTAPMMVMPIGCGVEIDPESRSLGLLDSGVV